MKDDVPVEKCTGCAACSFCCSEEAISMAEDGEGFKSPRINEEKCNSCGLCINICPVNNVPTIKLFDVSIVYAGWTNDDEVLQQSSSGGVFSEIARNVIREGGVVFGAAFDKKLTVRHIGVENWENLKALRGSKYVQSDVGDTYRQAENHLDSGRPVLFSGTPCQIAGLYATIGSNHDKLLTTDFICHGVPSPKVFRKAIASLEDHNGSKVVRIDFRNKLFGWLHPTVRIVFENGKIHDENFVDNHYNLGFLKNIYLRHSCHQCTIKCDRAVADITLGDFWQLAKYKPSLINRNGTSAVVINTMRGQRAIQGCKENLVLKECPLSYIEKESNLRKSVQPSLNREAFFARIDSLPFDELTRNYIKPRSAVVRNLARVRRIVRKWIQG